MGCGCQWDMQLRDEPCWQQSNCNGPAMHTVCNALQRDDHHSGVCKHVQHASTMRLMISTEHATPSCKLPEELDKCDHRQCKSENYQHCCAHQAQPWRAECCQRSLPHLRLCYQCAARTSACPQQLLPSALPTAGCPAVRRVPSASLTQPALQRPLLCVPVQRPPSVPAHAHRKSTCSATSCAI